MSKRNRQTSITFPNILVLEGLYADTCDVVGEAGGIGVEENPWDYDGVQDALLSGRYHGLLLTGGSDINPNLYGEKPHPECYGIDNLRDLVEYRALDIAMSLGIPVLGICRGSQIMTAYRGGKLTQHISGHRGHRGDRHWVHAAPEARTWKAACNSRDMNVISLHHQCVRRPGKGMRIAAYGQDGTPEAVESKDGLWLGVQYHPEMNAYDNGNSYAIFQWLIRKAAEHAGGRAPHRPFRLVRQRAWRTSTTRELTPFTGVSAHEPFKPGDFDPTPTTPAPTKKPRQAGEAAIPSMREMVQIVEESAANVNAILEEITRREDDEDCMVINSTAVEEYSCMLPICPVCGMLFDARDDQIDHVRYVHGHEDYGPPFSKSYEERYPELEPPAGHPSWYDDDEHGVH